jgi:hypothetical protein
VLPQLSVQYEQADDVRRLLQTAKAIEVQVAAGDGQLARKQIRPRMALKPCHKKFQPLHLGSVPIRQQVEIAGKARAQPGPPRREMPVTLAGSLPPPSFPEPRSRAGRFTQ